MFKSNLEFIMLTNFNMIAAIFLFKFPIRYSIENGSIRFNFFKILCNKNLSDAKIGHSQNR